MDMSGQFHAPVALHHLHISPPTFLKNRNLQDGRIRDQGEMRGPVRISRYVAVREYFESAHPLIEVSWYSFHVWCSDDGLWGGVNSCMEGFSFAERMEVRQIPHIEFPKASVQGANGNKSPIVEGRVYNGQFKLCCRAINGTDIHHLRAGEEQA